MGDGKKNERAFNGTPEQMGAKPIFEEPKMRFPGKSYAIFVAATENYLMYVNALLNSIEKRRLHENCDLAVFLLHHDFSPECRYPAIARSEFPFRVVPIEVYREEIRHPASTKRIEFIKRARYHTIARYAQLFDVVCLLDADMFIVSPNFTKLFDLVNGTRCLIGCNERYKWDIGPNYQLHGESILPRGMRLRKMHCNVPAIFDMAEWAPVFEHYSKIAFDGKQDLPTGQMKGIGDIYCWNISVYALKRENDVITFPMETMSQVHQTNMRRWTYMINDHDHWRTYAGDEVYTIHGRVAQQDFVDGSMERFEHMEKDPDVIRKESGNVRRGLQAIQREWYDLNFNHRLKLDRFIPKDPNWERYQ
jgi:hypothetical protein